MAILNNYPILITGSSGLIGHHLRQALKQQGAIVKGLDLNANVKSERGDICDSHTVNHAVNGVRGIVHCAAVSRVIWGEKNPTLCVATNEQGTNTILKEALASPLKPWVIYASSREVYGQQATLPVKEDAKLKPCNIYARTKVNAEQNTLHYQKLGLNTAIMRYSNVYGWVNDHVDRVLPAFCRRVVEGETLFVEGKDNLFDFTYIDDVVDGITKAIAQLVDGSQLPPIHLTTGVGTTLMEAAALAITAIKTQSHIIEKPPRHFDVATFTGSPQRAKQLLDWEAKVLPSEGIPQLINAFQTL